MDTTEIPGIELLQSSGNEIAQQKIKDMLTQFIQQVYIFKGKKDEELLNRLISDNGNSGGSNSSSPNSNGSGSGGSSHDRSNCVRLNGNADSYKWYWIIMDKSVLEGATGPKCKPDNHIITYNDRLNFKWVCHACRKRAKTLSDVVLHIALEHRTNEKIIIHDIDGNKLSDLIYSITDDYGRKIDKFKQANSSSNNATCPTNTAANIPLDKSTLPTLPNLATNVSLKHSSSSNSSSENLIPPVSRNVKAKLMQSKSFDVNDSKFNLLTRHTAMLPLLNSDNNLQEINTPSTNGMGTPVGGMSGTHARHDRSNSGPIRSHPPLLKTRSMSPYFVGSKNRKNLPFSKLTDNNNKNLGVDFDIKKEVKISNSSHVTRQGKSKYKAMTEYYQQKNDQDTANMASVLIGGNGATQKLHNNSIGHNNAAKVAQAAQVQAAQVQTNDTTTPVTAQTAQSALNAATAALANTLAQSSVPSQNSQKPQLITKDSGFSENNIDKSIKFNQGPGASANGELSVLQVLQRSQANQAANAALTVNTSQANLNASPNVGINFSNSSGLLSTNIGTIDSLITNNWRGDDHDIL